MKVVATYSIKGGVGKTSAAVNLAALAALEGRRVLVWDLDPQGAATYLFRIRPKVRGGGRKLVHGRRDADESIKGTDVEGLDLLPADFSYRNLDLDLDDIKRPERGLARVLAPVEDDYDLVVLDCAPSISLTSEGVFHAAQLLLVPVIPAPLALRTVDQLRVFLGEEVPQPPDVLPFFSMADGRKRLHREVMAALPGAAETPIPNASAVERMGLERAPLVVARPSAPAARAYAALWAEVAARLA
jgi:cellulose biosynthesis protein BcsQ